MAFANLGQVFVRSFVEAGIPKERTFGTLLRWGLNYGRKKIYEDYDFYKRLKRNIERIKYVPKSYQPSRALFTKSKRLMTRRFKYGVRVYLFDYRTKETRSEMRYVSSDRLITRGKAESEALKSVLLGKRAGYYDIESFRLEELWESE